MFAGDDPEAEPTVAAVELLKTAVAACKWAARLNHRQAEFALALAREAEEETAELAKTRKRKR